MKRTESMCIKIVSEESISIHSYYTPFFTKIQAFLAKMGFFVDYANIYVNIVM